MVMRIQRLPDRELLLKLKYMDSSHPPPLILIVHHVLYM